VLALKAEGR